MLINYTLPVTKETKALKHTRKNTGLEIYLLIKFKVLLLCFKVTLLSWLILYVCYVYKRDEGKTKQFNVDNLKRMWKDCSNFRISVKWRVRHRELSSNRTFSHLHRIEFYKMDTRNKCWNILQNILHSFCQLKYLVSRKLTAYAINTYFHIQTEVVRYIMFFSLTSVA